MFLYILWPLLLEMICCRCLLWDVTQWSTARPRPSRWLSLPLLSSSSSLLASSSCAGDRLLSGSVQPLKSLPHLKRSTSRTCRWTATKIPLIATSKWTRRHKHIKKPSVCFSMCPSQLSFFSVFAGDVFFFFWKSRKYFLLDVLTLFSLDYKCAIDMRSMFMSSFAS